MCFGAGRAVGSKKRFWVPKPVFGAKSRKMPESRTFRAFAPRRRRHAPTPCKTNRFPPSRGGQKATKTPGKILQGALAVILFNGATEIPTKPQPAINFDRNQAGSIAYLRGGRRTHTEDRFPNRTSSRASGPNPVGGDLHPPPQYGGRGT